MRRLGSSAAFTLLEMLIVLLIIGILIAIAVPVFGGQTGKAKDSEAKQYLTVAYRAAKASTVKESGVGAYGPASEVRAAIADSEDELTVVTGTCPNGVEAGNPKKVVVDSQTGGDTLVLCDSTDARVWRLEDSTATDRQPRLTSSSAPAPPSSPTLIAAGDIRYVAVSPDGDRLAYVAATVAGYELRLSDADGSAVTTVGTTTNDRPSFSGDGQQVVYAGSGGSSLLRVAAAGGGTPVTLYGGAVHSPSYAGSDIVFTASPALGRIELYRLAAGETTPTQLTNAVGDLVQEAVVSPAGDKVVFERSGGVTDLDLYDLTANTRSTVRAAIGQDSNGDSLPMWLPDSETVIYIVDSPSEVDKVRVDGSGFATLADVPDGVVYSHTDLSRDGSRLAYGRCTVSLGCDYSVQVASVGASLSGDQQVLDESYFAVPMAFAADASGLYVTSYGGDHPNGALLLVELP